MHADLSIIDTVSGNASIVKQISACIQREGYRPLKISNEPTDYSYSRNAISEKM